MTTSDIQLGASSISLVTGAATLLSLCTTVTTSDSSRSSWRRAQLLAPHGMRETPLAHYRSSCFATSFEPIPGIIGVGIVGVVRDDPLVRIVRLQYDKAEHHLA